MMEKDIKCKDRAGYINSQVVTIATSHKYLK